MNARALPQEATAGSRRTNTRLKRAPDDLQFPKDPPFIVLGLFYGFTLFHYLQGGYRFPALGEIRFAFLLGIFITIIALPIYLNRKSKAPSSLYGWAGAFIVCCLLMTVFSIDVKYSWDVFLDKVLKFSMFALFIATFASTPRLLLVFVIVFLLAFLKMAQEGVLGVVTGSLMWYNQGIERLHGATPLYEHPNSFAGTQIATLPFLIGLFAMVPKWAKIVIAGQILAVGTILVFCGSRTAYVAAVVAAVIFAFKGRSIFKGAVLCTVLAGIALYLVPEDYLGRLGTIVTQEDKQGESIDLRKEIFEDSLIIFRENPLGVGVAAFPKARLARFERQQDTHNLYTEVATNLGIQGIVIFFPLLAVVLLTLRRSIKSIQAQMSQLANHGTAPSRSDAHLNSHKRDLQISLAIAQALVGFLAIRLLLGAFGHDLYEIYWWFALGMTIALANIEHTLRKRTNALSTIAAAAKVGTSLHTPFNSTGTQ